MSDDLSILQKESIQNKILTIRNKWIMVDRDLAELYGVSTKVLNQAVKRNVQRFPESFRFQLTDGEIKELVTNCDRFEKLKHSTTNPYAFTEQGVSMLSAVLRSDTAVRVSIQIINAFVAMRRFITSNAQVFQRLDTLEIKQLETDKKIDHVLNALESKEIRPKQGIFFDGQIFDANQFVSDIFRSAEESIVIDDTTVYHFGASLKDLSKKWFAFSKMEIGAVEMLAKLEMIS